MKQHIINVLFLIVVIGLGYFEFSDHCTIKNRKYNIDTIVVNRLVIPDNIEEDLPFVLSYYGIAHPEIVYAQAILETGHFTSYNCRVNNNLFGLYDSKNKQFFKFSHWTESVKAYKRMIQRKYKVDCNKPPNDEDYYKFLKDLGYAEDPLYINKVRNIVKRYETEEISN